MTKTIELTSPIKVNGVETDKLTMRAPKLRDQLAAQRSKGTDADREVALLANLCDAAPSDLEELDAADYQALQEAYTDFLSVRKKSAMAS